MVISSAQPFDPILAAIDRAPKGEPFTPEQAAELAQDLADIAAGRATLVAHEDVPDALAKIAGTLAA
jgi:hypothetical protein